MIIITLEKLQSAKSSAENSLMGLLLNKNVTNPPRLNLQEWPPVPMRFTIICSEATIITFSLNATCQSDGKINLGVNKEEDKVLFLPVQRHLYNCYLLMFNSVKLIVFFLIQVYWLIKYFILMKFSNLIFSTNC